MSFCEQCRKELVGVKKYCHYCGFKVLQKQTNTMILTDEPTEEDAPDFNDYSQKLSKFIVNSRPQFTVGIYGDWGTGKTTLMQMIRKKIDSEYQHIATTIWFDAWRYENEKYSAIIPLLRTITLSLKNASIDPKNKKRKAVLKRLNQKTDKMIEAISRNLNLKIEGNVLVTKMGTDINISKIIDDYRYGSMWKDQERIYFHEHISDHLKEELKIIRGKEGRDNFRIVIFVDDLDRCTPERALELLESIKTFFDIEGIIYVIGMDPQTIDPIINTKYGNNSKIDGMHYLQKIVQLQFPIPLWGSLDLSNVIENLVKKVGLSEDDLKEIQREEIQDLIKKATQLNPRDIKRFINAIVVAKEFYSQESANIDKIIAIQAFYFHGDKWVEFLRLLIPYEQRILFLMHFILMGEVESTGITNLKDLVKIIDEKYDVAKENTQITLYKSLLEAYRMNSSLKNIYSKLVENDDNDLFTFLKIASKSLLKIDKIENYLKIADTAGLTVKKKDTVEINTKKQLEYLQNGEVKEFNDYRKNENVIIHLPYADLKGIKLEGHVNLTSSLFFMADLSGADLYGAILYGAILYGADLTGADLTGADLTGANLSRANLSRAYLTGAYLTGAYLSRAYLSRANLSRANLSRADLYGANLSGADLYGADLRRSIIINNSFSESTTVTHADFYDAIIDNKKFLVHLDGHQSKNIPKEEIENKQELEQRLESRNLDQNLITKLLDLSKLPSI